MTFCRARAPAFNSPFIRAQPHTARLLWIVNIPRINTTYLWNRIFTPHIAFAIRTHKSQPVFQTRSAARKNEKKRFDMRRARRVIFRGSTLENILYSCDEYEGRTPRWWWIHGDTSAGKKRSVISARRDIISAAVFLPTTRSDDGPPLDGWLNPSLIWVCACGWSWFIFWVSFAFYLPTDCRVDDDESGAVDYTLLVEEWRTEGIEVGEREDVESPGHCAYPAIIITLNRYVVDEGGGSRCETVWHGP